MSGQILLPPVVLDVTGPLIFLAGPIQGAPDWQGEAIPLLRGLLPEVHIASPRRPYAPGEFEYAAQVDWETHFLRRAAAHGVILFWLAREADHRCDRAYAQTTRFELAEWKMRHERDGTRLVVGIDRGFTGGKYILHRLGQDCPGIPLLATLEATCRAAIERIQDTPQGENR
jgi:hypothetical protein